jgi:hypothetical protein
METLECGAWKDEIPVVVSKGMDRPVQAQGSKTAHFDQSCYLGGYASACACLEKCEELISELFELFRILRWFRSGRKSKAKRDLHLNNRDQTSWRIPAGLIDRGQKLCILLQLLMRKRGRMRLLRYKCGNEYVFLDSDWQS